MFLEELLTIEFTLIEEEPEEIDIQGIEEYKTEYAEVCSEIDLRYYINEKILPAIKQLDRKIKEGK